MNTEGSYAALTSDSSKVSDSLGRSGRRRAWSMDDKLAIVRETLAAGAVSQVVADRHGISTGLLYTWRKQMLRVAMTGFAAVEVTPVPEHTLQPAGPQSETATSASSIEIDLPTGVRLRVGADINTAALQRVLAALALS